MDVNYQEVVNFLVHIMYVMGPIAIVFIICGKTTNMFMSFIAGDKEVKL